MEEEPRSNEALLAQGIEHKRGGRLAEAIRCFEEARVEGCDPAVLVHLGVAQLEAGHPELAFEPLCTAWRQNPHRLETSMNLCVVLSRLGNHEEARLLVQRELRVHASEAWPLFMRGFVEENDGQDQKAIAAYEELLEAFPTHADGLLNLGRMLRERSEFVRAEGLLRRAVAARPRDPEAHLALARLLLLQGRRFEGAREYEWRRKRKGFREPHSPLWDGMEALGNRHLLFVAEQGLGDTLSQLPRVVQLARTQRVGLAVQPRLLPLLAAQAELKNVQLSSLEDPWPKHDLHLPLMSLPGLELPEARLPVIHADPARSLRWKVWLGDATPCIGIAWQGNPAFPDDAHRSIPLEAFRPLANRGRRLLALQKGPGCEAMETAGVPLLRPPETFDEKGAFLDTVALLEHCELLICSDSAIAHLAGIMGVPTWLALPSVPDWRWGLGSEHCEAYPSVRLVRRKDSWSELFERLGAELEARRPTPGLRSMEE